MNAQQYLENIRNISIFSDIKDNQKYMMLLLSLCRKKNYRSGETIIKEGEIGSEMYIVTSGGVTIQKKTLTGDSFNIAVLKAEQNIFFGEIALISDDRRTATVVATENSEFLILDKSSFSKMGDKYPQIGLPITRNISRIVCKRLQKTTDDMLILYDTLVKQISQ